MEWSVRSIHLLTHGLTFSEDKNDDQAQDRKAQGDAAADRGGEDEGGRGTEEGEG